MENTTELAALGIGGCTRALVFNAYDYRVLLPELLTCHMEISCFV